MEEKLNVLDAVKNIIDGGKLSLINCITRRYIPSDEKDEIANLVTTILFSKVNPETKQLDEFNVYQEPDLFFDKFIVTTTVIGAYTNIDMSDKVLVYDAFMKNEIYGLLLDEITDAKNFDINLFRQIKAKREFIKDSRKTSMDELLESLNGLVCTLNSKASELDVKKLDKVLKKLNPQEILKAYQKSGIGDEVRDKAIEELKIENIKLKNEIAARNVKA